MSQELSRFGGLIAAVLALGLVVAVFGEKLLFSVSGPETAIITRLKRAERLAWMRPEIDEYIKEETGHVAWILNDLRALGDDPDAVRRAGPGPQTEVMVAYAYDTVQRGNPVGFFGMVLVLEGTSIRLADRVADAVQQATRLPDNAFTYLRSHGALDQDHVRFYADLMDRLEQADDRAAVSHAAGMFYRLYGDIFRSLGPA